jgi:hypothetical protein
MKKKKAVQQRPTVAHQKGDIHFVDGVECVVRYLNAGKAWLFPVHDDETPPALMRNVAIARLDEYGDLKLL